MKKIISKLIQPTTFVLAASLARILPHPANFAPIAAMALFGGAYLGKKQAFLIPLAAMVISDAFIGFDSVPMRIAVYGSFLISILIGLWLKNHKNAKNIILGTLFSSVIFFIVTNSAVWAFGSMYPKSLAGIFECFTLALPFFRNTFLGDMFYSGVFFGGYELVKGLVSKRSLKLLWFKL